MVIMFIYGLTMLVNILEHLNFLVTLDVTNTFATLQQKQTHRDKQIAKNLFTPELEIGLL